MLAQLASEAQAMQTLLEHIGLLVTEEQSAFVPVQALPTVHLTQTPEEVVQIGVVVVAP